LSFGTRQARSSSSPPTTRRTAATAALTDLELVDELQGEAQIAPGDDGTHECARLGEQQEAHRAVDVYPAAVAVQGPVRRVGEHQHDGGRGQQHDD